MSCLTGSLTFCFKRVFSLPVKYSTNLDDTWKQCSSNSESLKTLLQQGISEPEFYGDLVYRFRKIIGKSNFLEQFRKLFNRYKRTSDSMTASS